MRRSFAALRLLCVAELWFELSFSSRIENDKQQALVLFRECGTRDLSLSASNCILHLDWPGSANLQAVVHGCAWRQVVGPKTCRWVVHFKQLNRRARLVLDRDLYTV